MPKKKANKGTFTKDRPGPGRPKGVPNKFTASIREAFKEAFDGMGGAQGLMEWGTANPNLFYPLASKLIPIEVTGPEGEPLTVKIIAPGGEPIA